MESHESLQSHSTDGLANDLAPSRVGHPASCGLSRLDSSQKRGGGNQDDVDICTVHREFV